MKRIVIISLTIAFCLSIGHADAQSISDEAMRHFDRGLAAVEMAKTSADYEDAIGEFEKAARLAPGWADVYYNLGMVQEKVNKYNEAVASLKQYLRLAPNASDTETVKSFINKLEYKVEQEQAMVAKYSPVIGVWHEKWVGTGIYRQDNGLWDVTRQGDELILGMVQKTVNKYNEEVARRIIGEFRGTFDGTTLTFYNPPGILPKGIYKQLKLVAPNHLRGRLLCGGDDPDIPIEWTR